MLETTLFFIKGFMSTSPTISLTSDCVKLITSTLASSSSSTVTSVSLSSCNCYSRNIADNLDCTTQNDGDSFSGKGR